MSVRGRWTLWDTLVCLLLAAVVMWIARKTAVELNYAWDWRSPLSYIIADDGAGGWRGGLLLEGMAMSLRLMLAGGSLALALGGILAALALSPLPPLRWLVRVYVEGLRHLPPIVFMFIFFYFIASPFLSGGAVMWDGALARFFLGDPALSENLLIGVLCLGVFEAAFVCDIIRAGVLAVERGQWDAAKSVGMKPLTVLRLVVLPQAVARVAAPLTGQLILLIKNSAILSVISVQELAFTAQETAVSTQQVFETWLLAAAFYFALCYPLARLAARLEKNLK